MWKHERKEQDLFEEIIKDISITKYDGKDWGKSKLVTHEQDLKDSYYVDRTTDLKIILKRRKKN